jgi:N6-L-threonylcarbamoyladenine synthase
MKILSIETSCDETAVSIVEASGGLEKPSFFALGNALFSQIEIHKKYGGVFPTLAKREHAKNLTPLLAQALTEAKLYHKINPLDGNLRGKKKCGVIRKMLERENGLYEDFEKYLKDVKKPEVDIIAVTSGPGLEPALWVGISFAKALAKLWDIPLVPINHMEGHITSVLLDSEKNKKGKIQNQDFKSEKENGDMVRFPAVALLISGGHTELLEISDWCQYKIIGQTKDDAVGEAFDKVARMLGLPYPGGPEISRLAEIARTENIPPKSKLPRPMIHSGNLDFSFSGLKTAVLYYIRDNKPETDALRADLAREFEDAVVEILLKKTKEALLETGAKTLIIAGGVISNKKLKEEFGKLENEELKVMMPTRSAATDNALMIASACYINVLKNPKIISEDREIIANGNLRLSTI